MCTMTYHFGHDEFPVVIFHNREEDMVTPTTHRAVPLLTCDHSSGAWGNDQATRAR